MTYLPVCLALWVSVSGAAGAVVPNGLFGHHAVLQRNRPIPVWGQAGPGETVTVGLAGHRAEATADGQGRWRVELPALEAGGPYVLLIRGAENTLVFQDVWIGDVWVCSGQSNMERRLGLQPGQEPIDHWEQDVATAQYPLIRQFQVGRRPSPRPLEQVEGQWTVCSPETAADFSAVGFFFARDLHRHLKVPVGLLFTAWGGTIAEAWTSGESLDDLEDFRQAVEEVRQRAQAPDPVESFQQRRSDWYRRYDLGLQQQPAWFAVEANDADWQVTHLPAPWETAGLPGFDGMVWFRKTLDLPDHWAGQEAELSLGPIDDQDTTWVNGVQVGQQDNWQSGRIYRVPAGLLQAGRNVIAVRVLDTGGPGGIYGQPKQMSLRVPGQGETARVGLAGPWRWRVSRSLADAPGVPRRPGTSPNVPTVLYNGMVAPLTPARIQGVLWYQGESNNDRPRQYRRLFPLLIEDWRRQWGLPELPFLFVQIAPHRDMSPELREAQLLTVKACPHTAMVVTTDVGDPDDIHPTRKQPVGARLALAARALAYGEPIEYSGPLYERMEVDGAEVRLHFSHVGSGLVAQGGEPLRGFTVAGPDGRFVPAEARIEADTVVVHSPQGPAPVAVRYGWSNVPDGNLANREGLPASPFRTDVD